MTLLGTELAGATDVHLHPEGRAQGTYVVGLNGTGKTTMLTNTQIEKAPELRLFKLRLGAVHCGLFDTLEFVRNPLFIPRCCTL